MGTYSFNNDITKSLKKNSIEVKTFLKYWKIKIHINSMINNITIIIANILPTFRLERFPCLVNIMLFSYLKYFLCLHCKNFFGFISLSGKLTRQLHFVQTTEQSEVLQTRKKGFECRVLINTTDDAKKLLRWKFGQIANAKLFPLIM